MTDILIYGINGKMGKTVYDYALKRKDINIACGVDKHTFGNFNCPVFSRGIDVNCHFDVIIDFSAPSSIDDILSLAEEYNSPIVLATTGYTENEIEKILQASKNVPIYLSPNLSMGINSLISILPDICKTFNNYDVVLTETHKKNKKDKPSGTALKLKEIIDVATNRHTDVFSVRGGDLPGTHEISFLGEHESITITHTVFSREVFAAGAIDAGIKLTKLSSGLYTPFQL